MAEKGVKGRYYKPGRELAKKEIHRLILQENLTNAQLSERLQISRRSVERYLSEIYKEDNEVLIHPTKEVVATQFSIFSERVNRQIQDALQIAFDKSVAPADRIAAHDWVVTMSYALANMSAKLPSAIVRGLPTAVIKKLGTLPPPATAPPETSYVTGNP